MLCYAMLCYACDETYQKASQAEARDNLFSQFDEFNEFHRPEEFIELAKLIKLIKLLAP